MGPTSHQPPAQHNVKTHANNRMESHSVSRSKSPLARACRTFPSSMTTSTARPSTIVTFGSATAAAGSTIAMTVSEYHAHQNSTRWVSPEKGEGQGRDAYVLTRPTPHAPRPTPHTTHHTSQVLDQEAIVQASTSGILQPRVHQSRAKEPETGCGGGGGGESHHHISGRMKQQP
jgi:hypothetical protein